MLSEVAGQCITQTVKKNVIAAKLQTQQSNSLLKVIGNCATMQLLNSADVASEKEWHINSVFEALLCIGCC